MTTEQTQSGSGSSPLLCGGDIVDVPESVAVCPECGSKLYAQCEAWVSDTGQPCRDGVSVSCYREEAAIDEWEQDQDIGEDDDRSYYEVAHRWFQSDWQPVIDAVCKWANAVEC